MAQRINPGLPFFSCADIPHSRAIQPLFEPVAGKAISGTAQETAAIQAHMRHAGEFQAVLERETTFSLFSLGLTHCTHTEEVPAIPMMHWKAILGDA